MLADLRMNILLTGDINAGKTTVIDKTLAQYSGDVYGFRTVRVNTELDDFFGVYLQDIRDTESLFQISNRVGSCKRDKSLTSYGTVFETLGVKLLTFDILPDLVVMDELGVLEENCLMFQQQVLNCFDSDFDVIAAVKKRNSPFLNTIRQREDVIILEVKRNFEEVTEKIMEMLACGGSHEADLSCRCL